jgi:hypothetical protein
METPLYQQVRVHIYQHALRTGAMPTPGEIGAALGLGVQIVEDLLIDLHDRRLIDLDRETMRVRMAWPLSGLKTPYQVQIDGVTLNANCAWDMLGIPAMLRRDAALAAPCAFSGETLRMTVSGGELTGAEGVIHYLVPARDWHVDAVHT